LGHDHPELLIILLLIPGAVLIPVITLRAGVILVVVVVAVLVGAVEFLSLGAVDDEVGGVAALKAATRWSPPLFVKLVQCMKLPRQQGDLVIGDALILLIRSCDKKNKVNFKADETVVLVRLASWPPTQALVIKALLIREA
jgi:hypothetical protein